MRERGSRRPGLASVFSAILGLAAVLGSVRCGPPSVTPVVVSDRETACPAGTRQWRLEVLDRRAEREASDRLEALVRDSITRSFPGCDWSAGGAAPTVTLEVHRFTVSQEGGGNWNAAAEWTVLVRDASGRSVSEFQAESEVSRPNYRGSNNEKEALSQAFREAMERTLAGLRAVSLAG